MVEEPRVYIGKDSFFLPQDERYRRLILVSLFAVAFCIRLYHIGNIDYAPLHEYADAMIVRAYYLETNDLVPGWEKEVIKAQEKKLNHFEPPIMTNLAALGYRIAGGEHFWILRLFSSTLWLVGGVFLYLLARKMMSIDGALFAVSYYLFLPFGAYAGRSFQPEPLVVMTFIVSVFLIWGYHERQTTIWFLMSAIASSLAILVKVTCLFPILVSFIYLSIWRQGLNKTVVDWRLPAFVLISVLPGGIYATYAFFNDPTFRGSTFLLQPHLWLYPTFWAGWLCQVHLTVGLAAFLGGLTGVLLFHHGLARALLIGLWVGYFLYGLVFSYLISTHDYYQLFFIPIVALSLGPVLCLVFTSILAEVKGRLTRQCIFFICILLATASVGINIVQINYDRTARTLKREIAKAPEIGELVNHSTRTLYLSPFEGLPLLYHGKISGLCCSYYGDVIAKFISGVAEKTDMKAIFDPQYVGFEPEFFIVTEFLETRRFRELWEFLTQNFPLFARGPDYLIFDLRKRPGQSPP